MESSGVAPEPIPETSPAERVVADVLAIGASAARAECVRDTVPLWFHTFALAPGIYTPGIARDHGYRLPVMGVDRLAGRRVLADAPYGFHALLSDIESEMDPGSHDGTEAPEGATD